MKILETIKTNIVREIATSDDPFITERVLCYGYDVYRDVLQHASWPEYVYLLFKGNKPSKEEAWLLDRIAIVLANPGPRDYSVRAAMNAGVSNSTAASKLIAALTAGSGSCGGAREVFLAMQCLEASELGLQKFVNALKTTMIAGTEDIWSAMEHPPGFEPHCGVMSGPTRDALRYLGTRRAAVATRWMAENENAFRDALSSSISMSGLAAAVFHDLKLKPEEGELLYLYLRLPGAAAHALEQVSRGWRGYPFFGEALKRINR